MKGDPKLEETLRSFLNNELAINLDTLHKAPIKLWPPQEWHKAPAARLALAHIDLILSPHSNSKLLETILKVMNRRKTPHCMKRQHHSWGTQWRSRCDHHDQALLGEDGTASNGSV